MKKMGIVLMLIASLAVGIMVSCSSGGSSEVKYSDEDFIKSLAKGLEARWDIGLKQSNEGKEKPTVQGYKECIQAELDQVEQYQDAAFEDNILKEKAQAYINMLNESMDNVEYAVSETEYQKWADIFNQRTLMIKDFVDNYGLTVDSEHQKLLDEVLKRAEENTDE